MTTGFMLLGIAVMSGVTWAIRMIPLAVIRKKFKNRFFLSLLYYLPYGVLSPLLSALRRALRHDLSRGLFLVREHPRLIRRRGRRSDPFVLPREADRRRRRGGDHGVDGGDDDRVRGGQKAFIKSDIGNLVKSSAERVRQPHARQSSFHFQFTYNIVRCTLPRAAL